MTDTAPETSGSLSDQSGSAAPDMSTWTFEEAREELTHVVEVLQTGAPTLQEALDLWERGERLAAHCEDILRQAAVRIDSVIEASSANPVKGD